MWEQKSDLPLGWDLTYISPLEKNNVDRSDWIWKWLNEPDYQPPAKKWITEWKGEPIISSILIEYAAFSHAGEHTTMWLIRTKDHAYYWEELENVEHRYKKNELNPQVYDDIFRQTSSWEQAEPQRAEELSPQALSGYSGFISFYEKGKSRQMLLTLEDFITCASKDCKPGSKDLQLGRLFNAFRPVWDIND